MRKFGLGVAALGLLMLVGAVPVGILILVQLGVLQWVGFSWHAAMPFVITANVVAFLLGLLTDGISRGLMRLQPTRGRRVAVELGLDLLLNLLTYRAVASWGFHLTVSWALLLLLAAVGTLVAWILELGIGHITGDEE